MCRRGTTLARDRSVRLTFCNAGAIVFAAVFAVGAALVPAAAAEPEPIVNVEVVEGEIRAQVSLLVAAPRERVWSILSDFERAPEYIRDLQVSNVVSRAGDTLRVFQKDYFRFGPFRFPVETLSDVRLVEPSRIESRLVSGSLKRYEAVTELVREPGGTRILYRSVAVPGSALAILAGESFVKRETAARFRQIRDEILRREHVAAQ